MSLGGSESLIEHPASMTHASLTPDQLAHAGVAPGLVRCSVGLEDPGELIADLAAALEASKDTSSKEGEGEGEGEATTITINNHGSRGDDDESDDDDDDFKSDRAQLELVYDLPLPNYIEVVCI